MDVGALNALFAIPGHLHFELGVGGLSKAIIENSYSHCEVYLQGAHITSFYPKNHSETLWLSDDAIFEKGRSIRGGIPLCWPWFGPKAEAPQHGFARNRFFTLFGTTVNHRGETVLRLGLQDSDTTQHLFPYAFTLEYCITVGEALTLALTTTNDDTQPFELSQALHTYLRVSDIHQVRIEGFDGQEYWDKLQENRCFVQVGDVQIDAEVDRIYSNDASGCQLHDGNRCIDITSSGSRTTVVWNPWKDKAVLMPDFEDVGYRHMVCIEGANAGNDSCILNPGTSHTLTQKITPLR